MNVRFFIMPLRFHFLLTCIVITTPLKEDLPPRLIILKATRLENNEIDFLELNCSSLKQSIGNSAEFIVNGLTVEHISIRDNKCYNRKMEECITDHCQCFPRNNLYIYRFKMKILTTEIIVGCQMRFTDNKTSNIIKAVISIRFNGTVSDVYEYDAKILKHDNEKNEDKNEKNRATDHISRWVPALCGVLLVISAVLILVYCRRRDEHQPRSESFPLVKKGFFKRSLENMSTIEGQKVSFKCEIERQCLVNTVKWFKDDNILEVSPRFIIEVLNDTIYKLTILKTTLQDTGTYRVELQGAESTATLFVKDFFKRPLEYITTVEGKEVSFECEPEELCTAKWFKDGVMLESSLNLTIEPVIDGVHKLTIRNVRVEDTGTYMIYISMRGISRKAMLYVEGMFKRQLENILTTEGQEVSFECESVKEWPKNKIKWFKDDIELKTSASVQKNTKIHKFIIQKSTLGDTGTYRVELDGVASTATLFVNAKAKNIEIPDDLKTTKQSFARVMIVGKQSVGKTSLLRRLLYDNIDDVCSTDGIEIVECRCKIDINSGKWIIGKNLSDDNVYTTQRESTGFENPQTIHSDPCTFLSFCDFAGQKIFYATHQAFLTSSAIYILVANINDDISKQGGRQFFADFKDVGEYVDFWIDSIHCLNTAEPPENEFCQQSIDPPIIIVFTGLDKIPEKDVDKRKRELQEQLNMVIRNQSKGLHVRSIFWLSNTGDSNEKFDQLRTEISNMAGKMKHWDQNVPDEWLSLEDLIEQKKKDEKHFITLSEMYSSVKVAIPDKVVLLFLRFQHELGNILFFEDIQDLIILKPQWLADAFRCIVSDSINAELQLSANWSMYVQSGKISESLLKDLFKSKKFSEQTDNVVKVMEKFDILVKIDQSHFIVPSMMPSVSFEEVYNMLGVNHISTSWLCLKFAFIPPAFFNHICVWFMRRYEPMEITMEMNNRRVSLALFRGLCIFNINKSGLDKLIVAMSSDTIALQLLSFVPRGKELGYVCGNIHKDLIGKIEDIKHRYRSKIRYDLHFKCNTGHYYEDTKSYTDLNSSAVYFCAEHKLPHQAIDVLLPWMIDYYKMH